jgi:hypothetical protein
MERDADKYMNMDVDLSTDRTRTWTGQGRDTAVEMEITFLSSPRHLFKDSSVGNRQKI